MMHGRRLTEGLHQAIEAKEGAHIQPENQTLASVTIQNYFRLYGKLSGMTGTAATEAQEFLDIYKMDVAEIPTNRPVVRIDDDDEVYRTAAEKHVAIINLIEDCYRRGQPILVGTVSIEKSEQLSRRAVIEAEIADKKQQALAAGGLFVLGTERHESRRIDTQLRGRTGRQGDPGHSKFFLSCEDDLLRIFAGERLDAIMRTFGVQEGEAITHRWLNSAIATAQKKVEQRNYEIRKNLLKYDDVVNDQRKAVFEQRAEFMAAEDLSDAIAEFREDTIEDL